MGFTQDLATIFSAGFIILFLSIYWIINQINFERLWLSLLAIRADESGHAIFGEPLNWIWVHTYAAKSFTVCWPDFYLVWVTGFSARLTPILLAFTGALACLIPVVGIALAVIPPILVGLLTDVQLSLFSMLYTIMVLVGLGIWVRPRSVQSQVG